MDSNESMLVRMNQALSLLVGGLMFCAVCFAGYQCGPQAVSWFDKFRHWQLPKRETPWTAEQNWRQGPLLQGSVNEQLIGVVHGPVMSEEELRDIQNRAAQNIANDAIRRHQQATSHLQHGYRP